MSHSAVQRLCLLISLLPQGRCHAGMTVSTLYQRLRWQGFDVCKRTVQRDLEFLERAFPLVRDRGAAEGDRWKLGRKLNLEGFLRPIAYPEHPLDAADDDVEDKAFDEPIHAIPEWETDIVCHWPSDPEWS